MLTPSQRQALRLDRHLSVVANAGSGKTLVLVERYLDIVCRGDVAVEDVVAITFTEKAASELRRKIADGVARRLETHPAQRPVLERVRGQFPSAVIHTIHGFCSRILHEFPVEAGVDASFSVVEPLDRLSMLGESLTETYRAILREGAHPDLQEQLLEVIREVGKGTVTRILDTLGEKFELIEHLTAPGGLYERSDEEVLRHWQTGLDLRLEEAMENHEFLAQLGALLEAARGREAGNARAMLREFRTERDRRTRARLLLSIFDTALTAKHEPQKRFLGTGVVPPDTRLLTEQVKGILPLIESVLDPACRSAHVTLLRTTRVLLAVFRLALKRFAEKKAAAAQLDFDDLQFFTRDLLKKDFVRSRLAARYRYIMVDEFQDTNRLQYEILLPLIGGYRSGNLFIVGDPKQSIYGFRNADVAVFDRTCREIREASGEESHVVLGESFRLLPDIAAFVNTLFSRLMRSGGRGQGRGEVLYDELVVGRNNDDGGRVEILLLGDDDAMTEGEAVARRIRQLYGNRHQVYDGNEQRHDIRFRDFAVLLRNRKPLGDFEKAFVQYGIPYAVTGGTGYFQTQIIYDFFSYFRFILNRHDDVALAAILRSPFFTVSDAELFVAAGEARRGSLWDHLRQTRGKITAAALLRALEMLEEDLARGPRLTVPELLDRLIARSGIEAVSEAVPRGDQGMANLRKLQDIARSFDGRGFTTLYDFTARLKRLVEEEEREGQAVIDVQRDAVRIMTIHAAKGLEFPFVIVPSIERPFRSETPPYFDEDLGFGFDPGKGDDRVYPPVVRVLQQEAQAKAVAEEKRILYVACTRARDGLLLSVRQGKRPAKGWLAWIDDCLGPGTLEGAAVLEIPSSIRVMRTTGEAQAIVIREQALRLHITRAADLVEIPAVSASPRPSAGPARVAIEPIVRPPRGEVFSASRIRTYRECPARYYLHYVLGMPDRAAAAGMSETEAGAEDVDAPLSADLRGVIIHGVLQRIDRLPREAIPAAVREQASALGGASEADLANIAATIRSVVTSPFWEILSMGTQTQTELPLTGVLDGDFLTGTLDRLFLDRDGIQHIVDYKTDRVDADRTEERMEGYRMQLSVYAVLVNRLHPAPRVRCTVLFTEHPDRPVTFEFTQEDLLIVEQELRETAKRINSLDFQPIESPCPPCPFHDNGGCLKVRLEISSSG